MRPHGGTRCQPVQKDQSSIAAIGSELLDFTFFISCLQPSRPACRRWPGTAGQRRGPRPDRNTRLHNILASSLGSSPRGCDGAGTEWQKLGVVGLFGTNKRRFPPCPRAPLNRRKVKGLFRFQQQHHTADEDQNNKLGITRPKPS